MDKENIFDVEYEDNEREINGKPTYYSTSQVSEMIGESDSTIRFWCSKFKSLIQIKTSGRNRKFSESNIEKLKYIKKLLREDKFSIKQIIELSQEKNISLVKEDITDEPFMLQALASALSIEMNNKIEQFKEDVISELSYDIEQNMQKQFQEQKEYIKVLESKIDNFTNVIEKNNTTIIDSIEQNATARDIDMINKLRDGMNRGEDNKVVEKKKGLFRKIFG